MADIKTWGEFEGAIKEIITAIVNKTNPPNDYQATVRTQSLYSTLSPAINEYYRQMKTGELGEPNEENLNKMMNLFWNRLKNNSTVEDQRMNKEGFFKAMNEQIIDHQQQFANHKNTIDSIACFRFAADGRLDDGEYWSLENLGNLASTMESLDVPLTIDSKDVRKAIMGELGNHATRQCGQPMDEEEVTVYLCGGYGGGGSSEEDKNDIGHGQLLPEHMWIEVHRKGKPTISIDTFPSRPPNAMIGARLNENFEGPPSEPRRIHTDDKTFKQKIPGLPLGVMQALAKEDYTILNNKHMRTVSNPGGLFIKPDGTLLKNAEAVNAFDRLTNPLNALLQDCNSIKPERITKSKTMREATDCKNKLLAELINLEEKKDTLVKGEDKIALQEKIDEKRLKIEELFTAKEKIGNTIQNVKTAAEKYLQWSNTNATGWRLSNWSYGSYGREQADKLIKMIEQDKPMAEILKATHDIVNTSGVNANSFTRYLHDALHTEEPKLVGRETLTERFKSYKEKLQGELNDLERTEERNNRMRLN
ncbi:hypothetical protein [Legionella sainthelensi]|uniref:Uncharacterized protein n=1 Tax=Legionella sainthelensi TaxID=28087 RepID=A0A2H5FPG9_9GAMM|nr:hypothetical protein [Legionella sainthelensi]AUH73478.1 hypothetical protein CAB17_16515 [Legionella sainthelensi]